MFCARPCRSRRLNGADLSSAKLNGADLSSAQLNGADLFFAKTNPKISFCTGVMNRLPHLQKTLLKNIEATKAYNVEFSILDYNSSDGFREWMSQNMKEHIKSGKVTYTQETTAKSFHMAKVKNLAHRFATGDILVSLDGDNYVDAETCEKLLAAYKRNPNSIFHGWSGTWQDGTCGRLAVPKDVFYRVGGYDEELLPYGFEERDLIARAHHLGVQYQRVPWKAGAFELAGDHTNRKGENDLNAQNIHRSHENVTHGKFIANLTHGWGAGKIMHGIYSKSVIDYKPVHPVAHDEEREATDAQLARLLFR